MGLRNMHTRPLLIEGFVVVVVVVFLENDMFGKLWKKELGDNFVVVAVVFCVVVTNKAIFAGTLCLCVCVHVCVCVAHACMRVCVCLLVRAHTC